MSLPGNNRLELNVATMIAALQHYFDNVLFKAGVGLRVNSVVEVENGVFKVTVSEVKPSGSG